MVKNPPANAGDTIMWVQSLGWEDPLEKKMAIYSSVLTWEIPWTEEPGREQLGLQRLGNDQCTHTHNVKQNKTSSLVLKESTTRGERPCNSIIHNAVHKVVHRIVLWDQKQDN